jgi:hypothetical protein
MYRNILETRAITEHALIVVDEDKVIQDDKLELLSE